MRIEYGLGMNVTCYLDSKRLDEELGEILDGGLQKPETSQLGRGLLYINLQRGLSKPTIGVGRLDDLVVSIPDDFDVKDLKEWIGRPITSEALKERFPNHNFTFCVAA